MEIKNFNFEYSEGIYKVFCSEEKDWYLFEKSQILYAENSIESGANLFILAPPRGQKSALLSILYKKFKNKSYFFDLKRYSSLNSLATIESIIAEILECTKGCYNNNLKLQLKKKSFGKFIENMNSVINERIILFLDSVEEIKLKALKDIISSFNLPLLFSSVNIQLVVASSYFIPSLSENLALESDKLNILEIKNPNSIAIDILLKNFEKNENISLSFDAKKLLIENINNDRYLLLKIIRKAIYSTIEYPSKFYSLNEPLKITRQQVQIALDWFLEDEYNKDVPMIRSIRSIEKNPKILLSIYKAILFNSDTTDSEVNEREIILTGAFSINSSNKKLEIKNRIYHLVLQKHFTLDRICYVLQTGGFIQEALDLVGSLMEECDEIDRIVLRSKYISVLFSYLISSSDINDSVRVLKNAFIVLFKSPDIVIVLKSFFNLQKVIKPDYYSFIKFDVAKDIDGDELWDEDYYFADKFSNNSLFIRLIDKDQNIYGLIIFPGYKGKTQSDNFFWLINSVKQIGIILKSILEKLSAELEISIYAKKMESLNTVIEKLLSTLDENMIFDSINNFIIDLLDSDSSLFIIADQKNRNILNFRAEPYADEYKDQFSWDELMDGISGEVIRTGKSIIEPNAQFSKYNKGKALENCIRHKTGPIIVAPIVNKKNRKNNKSTQNNSIGTLTACRKENRIPFNSSEYNIACMLAKQASIAIENARLYSKLREANNCAKLIAEATLEKGFERTAVRVANGLKDMLHCEAVMIIYTDPNCKRIRRDPVDIGFSNCDCVINLSEIERIMDTSIDKNSIKIFKKQKNKNIFESNFLRESKIETFISLPMKLYENFESIEKNENQSNLGFIFLGFFKEYNLNIDDENYLELFCLQSSVAVFKDIMFEEMDQHRRKENIGKAICYISAQSNFLNHKVPEYFSTIRAKIENILGISTDIEKSKIDSYAKDILDSIESRLKKTIELIEEIKIEHKEKLFISSNDKDSDSCFDCHRINEDYILSKVMERHERRQFKIEPNIIVINNLLCDVRAKISERHLSYILEILVNNAIREMSYNYKSTIMFFVSNNTEEIKILIKDFGGGIPYEIREKLFFEQIKQNQNDRTGGGLLLASMLLDYWGGHIELVNSSPGGSTFCISLIKVSKLILDA